MVEGSIFVLPDLHTFYQTKSEQTNFFLFFFFHKKKLLVLQNVVATAMMMELVTLVTGIVEAKNMAWDI